MNTVSTVFRSKAAQCSLFLYLALATTAPAFSAATPVASPDDRRIQYVAYNPDNVVNIRAKVGRVVLVQLDPAERIEGDAAAVAMGDAAAWKLSVKGNNILFKPAAFSPETNLIITGSKRTYAFHLSLSGGRDKRGRSIQSPTYVLRFTYPDDDARKRMEQLDKNNQARALFAEYDRQHNQYRNHNYHGRGSKHLAPTEMYDNGRFTFLRFDNARDLPAIFKILPDGKESLVNSHIEGNTVVVHETAKNFVLRLGRSVLGIENRAYDDAGQFNRAGTSSPDSIRVIKGGK